MRQRTQEAELRGKEIPDWAGGRLRNNNLAKKKKKKKKKRKKEKKEKVQEASKTKIQVSSWASNLWLTRPSRGYRETWNTHFEKLTGLLAPRKSAPCELLRSFSCPHSSRAWLLRLYFLTYFMSSVKAALSQSLGVSFSRRVLSALLTWIRRWLDSWWRLFCDGFPWGRWLSVSVTLAPGLHPSLRLGPRWRATAG